MLVALFNEHSRSLVNLARLFVDHRDAAEDIVQEAFIRLDRSLHRINDRNKIDAYLRSIVLNLARDHNRRGLLSLRHVGPVNELDLRGVDERIASRTDQQTLVGALGRLPQRQHDCLALHYLLELTVPEVATTLTLSPNSVKTHLKRGLAALRVDHDLALDISEESSTIRVVTTGLHGAGANVCCADRRDLVDHRSAPWTERNPPTRDRPAPDPKQTTRPANTGARWARIGRTGSVPHRKDDLQ